MAPGIKAEGIHEYRFMKCDGDARVLGEENPGRFSVSHNPDTGARHGSLPVTKDDLFNLLQAAPFGAYAMSVDQVIVFWNSGAERILGYSRHEVLGRRCYEVVSGISHRGIAPECSDGCPSIRYLRAGLVPSPIRLGMLSSTGERKWVSVTPMVVAGILRDAPLLVHLFNDSPDPEYSDSTGSLLRERLVAGGADILTDHPAEPAATGNDPALTPRELEVLRYVALGWESVRIAAELDISRHTVRNHIRNLRLKLKATTKLDAVVTGIRLGILSLG